MIELNLELAKNFLNQNSITDYEIKKVAGDCSFRSYYRIFLKDKNLILMFAPPSHEDVIPFIKIDEFLIENGFSAPKIFAKDEKNGFLLLEDFGDNSYSKALIKNNSKDFEFELYQDACNCLIEIQKKQIPEDILSYNNLVLMKEVMIFIDWYLPLKKKMICLQDKACFKMLFLELFDLLDKENQTTVLRDYHADNLMVLEDKNGYKKVGLLDFQDALIGSKAYDLVSLLEDARRDVDEENRKKLFDFFVENSGVNKEKFIRDYEILSLQRNIKILGIFARMSLRGGRHNYLELIPRVTKFIENRIFSNNPIFSEIGEFLKRFL